MKNEKELRTIECFQGDGRWAKGGDCWVKCTMGQLEAGDKFRVLEPDGTQVGGVFTAESPARIKIISEIYVSPTSISGIMGMEILK
jgi:hypothetical protein